MLTDLVDPQTDPLSEKNIVVFSPPDTLRDLVNIIKNGRNVMFLAGLETTLEDGDVIALFPPVAGG